jgi:hypothetical protein
LTTSSKTTRQAIANLENKSSTPLKKTGASEFVSVSSMGGTAYLKKEEPNKTTMNAKGETKKMVQEKLKVSRIYFMAAIIIVFAVFQLFESMTESSA